MSNKSSLRNAVLKRLLEANASDSQESEESSQDSGKDKAETCPHCGQPMPEGAESDED